MKVGDKVRVKSKEEILKTLNKDYRCIHPNKDESHINFNDLMFDYTDLIGTISKIANTTGNIQIKFTNQTSSLWWHPSWLELIPEEAAYLNDGSKEQRSLCLALIRQTMSDNEPNVEHLRHYNNKAFPNDIHKGFSYIDYPQDKWRFEARVAENIPDWPCLNLKPEILEEAIKNCLTQCGLEWFRTYIEQDIAYWFIFDNTEKPYFWYKVAGMSNRNPGTSKDTNVKQPYKTKENEIKFQRRKSTILRGVVPEGSQQSSGKCKTATCSGYLSYQVCSGR